MAETLRIGIIGAGNNTRLRHIPGLRSIAGIELTGVVNSSPESTRQVADEYNIPKTYATWQELVADPEIDAVVIGTWPDLHCAASCAALEAGKHVLTEARMACDLAEARQMLAASTAHPELVAQIVPSPFGLVSGPVITDLLKTYFIGDLREVVVLGANNQFWDYSQPLQPRQEASRSGKNILSLGILHETLMRWAPEPVQVFAQFETFEPTRPIPEESRFADVTIPDSVQVVAELKGGARCLYHLSGVILFGPGLQIHLYGSRGTIKVEFRDGEEKVWCGRADDSELKLLEIPAEERGAWHVEADFINAIRNKTPVTLTDFKTGVKYMEFLEAVHRSAEQNSPVELPLD